MALPTSQLPGCSTYEFCCEDFFNALRIHESGSNQFENWWPGGFGNGGALGDANVRRPTRNPPGGPFPGRPNNQDQWNSVGGFQIQDGYFTDGTVAGNGFRGCGTRRPAIGGYGVPATGAPPTNRIMPPQNITFDDMRTNERLSKHIICCYMKRYTNRVRGIIGRGDAGAQGIVGRLQCCQQYGTPMMPPGPAVACTGTLADVEKLARLHNGGGRLVSTNVDRMNGAIAATDDYWAGLCRQFGAVDTAHPRALGLCDCTR